MKGVVFTEWMAFVDETYGPDLLEDVIDAVDVPSGCVYTAVGSYPVQELGTLLGALSAQVGMNVPDLLRAFGRHLLRRFAKGYPDFFDVDGPLELLSSVDSVIHVTVRKLYPDAELPRFEIVKQGRHRLVLDYTSPRCLGPLAEGLMAECLAHFGRTGTIAIEPTSRDGSELRFDVRLDAA